MANILAWDHILEGVNIPSAFVPNSSSATSPSVRHRVEQQLLMELSAGQYKLVQHKPKIVSALSVVDKPDGDIRLIHDLSRPVNGGVNSFASKDDVTYQSFSDALEVVEPNFFVAKVDLKGAYRSVHIRECEHTLTGLHWEFKDAPTQFLVDTRLPFGSRKSPAVFTRLTQAVRRFMVRQGYTGTVVYLDDFLVSGATKESCREAYNYLIHLLRSLGFQINWSKVCDPTQKMTFLGIVMDTVHGVLTLEPTKVKGLCELIRSFQLKTRCTRRQLETLAGKLSWAAHIIPWGRAYIRPIFHLISSLKNPRHKCRITDMIKNDLSWWLYWLDNGKNSARMWDSRPVISAYTDSSLKGGGAFCQNDWVFTDWSSDRPHIANEHINIKELAAVLVAAERWAPCWAGHRINICTDNTVTAAAINNSTTSNNSGLQILKCLSSLSILFDFSIHATYIPGVSNVLADCISRFHDFTMIFNFFNYIKNNNCIYLLHEHMSHSSLMSISDQVIKWIHYSHS